MLPEIVGTPLNDDLRAKPHGACLVGLQGDDTLDGKNGGDWLVCGNGKDVCKGRAGDDVILGGPGDDDIDGSSGNDQLHGGDGADTINAGSHNDVVFGGAGNDWIQTLSGNDRVIGGFGSDWIDGQAHADVIVPGPGPDEVHAGSGDDFVVIFDLCEVEPGEVLDGGPGHDTLVLPVELDQIMAAGATVVGFEEIAIDPTRRLLSECVDAPEPKPLDAGRLCSLLEQSSGLVEATIDEVIYTFHPFRGPREDVVLGNLTVHFGTVPGNGLTLRSFRGPLEPPFDPEDPNEVFVDATEMPRFVAGARYLLFLRNSSWFYSPVVGTGAFRVETIGTKEVLIDQAGYALNPNPTMDAFEVGDPLVADSVIAPDPLTPKRLFDTTLNLGAPADPQPMLPGVDEDTVANAWDRAGFVAFIGNLAQGCTLPFEGEFLEWPDPRLRWDKLGEGQLANPNPGQGAEVPCNGIHPETGEIRLCP